MTPQLVTVDEAKLHLRVDHDEDDDSIDGFIYAASAAVLNYLGDAQFDFVDTSGELIEDSSGTMIPYPVIQAVLLLVGVFYRYRESMGPDVIDSRYGYGYLPPAVVALLYPLRDPVIA